MNRWRCCCRPGNAGSNTAADHIDGGPGRAARSCRLPATGRPGRRVLIRTDARRRHPRVPRLADPRGGCRTRSGSPCPTTSSTSIGADPRRRRGPRPTTPTAGPRRRLGRRGHRAARPVRLAARDAGDRPRKERPHPGAQLRFTDVDGHRLTAFATNTRRGQLADLELRHRRRARCEDRIRVREGHRPAATCPCTTSPRTRSGAPSSRWPAS